MAACALAVIVVVLGATVPKVIPQNRRQVPSWVTETHPAGFAIFGYEMGSGMRTYSPTFLPHLVAIGMVANTGVIAPLAGGLGFALGRYAMVPYYYRFTGRRKESYDFSGYPLAARFAMGITASAVLAALVIA